MKRKSFLGLTATILFLALFFTGCPQAVDPDKEVVQKPSTTSQKIEAVETTGEMGKPETAADGTITLTTTDSTGGKYTFKQIGGGVSSIRAASPSGTWDYTNSKNIKQFEGTFNGDIAKEGANDLNLTVEKAADATGTLQEVTEPQSFNFEVSDTGIFSATIPAVEIAKENTTTTPPANEVKLIKTATMEGSNSGEGYFCDDEYRMTYEFYSDKTFKSYYQQKHTFSEINFTYTFEGLALEGTYTGNPLVDGSVIFNIQKWNKFLARGGTIDSSEVTEVFTAYKNGATSKTITITEADMTPFSMTAQNIISGDSVIAEKHDFATYSPNEDNSTTFKLEIVGDDTELFKLCYCLGEKNGKGGYNVSTQGEYCDLSETISILDATENTVIVPYLFIDQDGNNTMDDGTDIIVKVATINLKLGYQTTAKVEIKKLPIQFTISGATNQYQNIRISTGYNGITVPMSKGKIDVYVNNPQTGSIRYISLTAEEHSTNEYGSLNKYSISDTVEFYLDEGTPPTSVTLTLYDKLEEGKKITIEEYTTSETSTPEEKQFRFVEGNNGNIIFYIPTGTGSDGEFLSPIASRTGSNLTKSLINCTYAGLANLRDAANDNFTYQFAGLVDNMKDIVYFLENRMNLTVEGKELIGL